MGPVDVNRPRVAVRQGLTSPWPDHLFLAPSGSAAANWAALRTSDGQLMELPLDRWHGVADAADRAVLERATGPVLDVGCGPGRHVEALVSAGTEVLGIDSSNQAVRTARRRGAPVVRTSVFGAVPDIGRWRTALLLDGNIGIGGDERVLLERVAELLAPGGCVLAELSPPTARPGRFRARVERVGGPSAWFPWASVTASGIGAVADAVGYVVDDVWELGGRWFVELVLPVADERGGEEVGGLVTAS